MTPKTKKIWTLGSIALLILILMAIVFAEAALNINKYISPSNPFQVVLLFALTTLIVVSLIVFSLILSRNLIKLFLERRTRKLGSKFKIKLLVAFLGLSFIPAIFLFIFAYGLINRSLDKWFSMPVDLVLRNAHDIVTQYQQDFAEQTFYYAKHLSTSPQVRAALRARNLNALRAAVENSARDFQIDGIAFYDSQGGRLWIYHLPGLGTSTTMDRELDDSGRLLRQRAEISQEGEIQGQPFSLAGLGVFDERLHLLAHLSVIHFYPSNLQTKINQIRTERRNFSALSRDIKVFKKIKVLTLLWITIAILFSASWIALYISKRITVPIQALAQATEKVAAGDLDYRVTVSAQDELGLLVESFNAMTQELHDKNQTIQRSTEELEQANRELEARRHYIETIVESIPSGVISLTNDLRVSQLNGAARQLLNSPATSPPCLLSDLFDPAVTSILEQLLNRARLLSIVSREMTLPRGESSLYCAITACALRETPAQNLGFVLVIEDLTELLRAQKSAAWREVARRMAHEIKNPLTPIQLSAERILKNLERVQAMPSPAGGPSPAADPLTERLVECANTINQEVSALKNMVDEFSRFARLPSAHPVSSDLNKIIDQTLSAYDGRLKNIRIDKELRTALPAVKVDPEQFKRVFINLIDNALEAMAGAAEKHLGFKTRYDDRRETVEVMVSDSGHGVRPQDRDKLFLPYFSTRKRGTGLGLAIVNRIVADHNGNIRVEDNYPRGTRFIIELPALNG